MARTFQELLTSLFDTACRVELDKLKEIVRGKDENLASRGLGQSTIRVQVTTQFFVDGYERILSEVRGHLDIPAESIGIRTTPDASEFSALFASEAEGVRRKLGQKRNSYLSNLDVSWRSGDDFEQRTINLRDRAVASLAFHVGTLVGPEDPHLELWKKIVRVVEADMVSRSHDITEAARRDAHALGQRRPPPREAYDETFIAKIYMKAMRKRIDLIFTVYPNAVRDLSIELPRALLPLVQTHVRALADEAVNDFRRIVTDEFDEWGHDVPQTVIDASVEAALSSVVVGTEKLLVTLEPRRTETQKAVPHPIPEPAIDKSRKRIWFNEPYKIVRTAIGAVLGAILILYFVTRPNSERERTIQDRALIRDSLTAVLERVRSAASILRGTAMSYERQKGDDSLVAQSARSYDSTISVLNVDWEPRKLKLATLYDSSFITQYDGIRMLAHSVGVEATRIPDLFKKYAVTGPTYSGFVEAQLELTGQITAFERRLSQYRQ